MKTHRPSAAALRSAKNETFQLQRLLDLTDRELTRLRAELDTARRELETERAERGVIVAQLAKELARHAYRASLAHRNAAKAGT